MADAGGKRRRAGVCGTSVSPTDIENFIAPVYEKKDGDKKFIKDVVDRLPVLFGHISEEAKNNVIMAFDSREVPSGTAVINQGDNGDYFYVVDSGRFAVSVARPGEEGRGNVVLETKKGGSFGELALLYNAPRAATVAAVEDSRVWQMDRDTFRMMLVTSENTKKKEWEGFLTEVKIFGVLNDYERGQVSDILKIETFQPGMKIVGQGEPGDKFYIVESGHARASIYSKEAEAEVTVCMYEKGGYFGELALIEQSGKRAASVYAISKCNLLWIDKLTFDRVFGPIFPKLRENADAYPSVQDALKRIDEQH